jgi:GalNAc-alpha-(1->4)-GalNAc-alpha-(1->3)-diNAcBac-PP-undecaprenol alpha-1,4-N-acetyl-D-galactosaminyltransferase
MYSLSRAGGAERMICQLASDLGVRGYSVFLFSWDQQDTVCFYPLDASVQWIRLGFKGGWLDKIRRTRDLYRHLKNDYIKILIGFVMSADKTVYAAAKLAGSKLVVAERNSPSMYWFRHKAVERWITFGLLHLADRITVQMQSFTTGYPVHLRQRIETIPNPVPVAKSRACPGIPNSSGRHIILVISRLDNKQKRIDCLLKAFALVAPDHPTWDLRIVGDGPDYNALVDLASDCKLGARICIKPARTNVFDLYANAHLFAIPSLWEGFPNALAEALAHGLPAVGFADAGGVADLISGSGGGWLASGVNDHQSLALTLAQAMGDDVERSRRGALAIEGMAVFVPAIQFERWDALIRSTLQEHVY